MCRISILYVAGLCNSQDVNSREPNFYQSQETKASGRRTPFGGKKTNAALFFLRHNRAKALINLF